MGRMPSVRPPAVSAGAGFDVLRVLAGAGLRCELRRRMPRLSAAAASPLRTPTPAGGSVCGLLVGRAYGLARSTCCRCEVMLTARVPHAQHNVLVACRARCGLRLRQALMETCVIWDTCLALGGHQR